jgi:hypothetical protein
LTDSLLTASIADWASESILTNHWSANSGSIGVLLRSLCGNSMSRSSTSPNRPSVSRSSTTRPRLFDRQPFIRSRGCIERAVGAEDVDHRQVASQPDLIIVRIMRRSDLDAPAAHFRFGPGSATSGIGRFCSGNINIRPSSAISRKLDQRRQQSLRRDASSSIWLRSPADLSRRRRQFFFRLDQRFAAPRPDRGEPQRRYRPASFRASRRDLDLGRLARLGIDHLITDVPKVSLTVSLNTSSSLTAVCRNVSQLTSACRDRSAVV